MAIGKIDYGEISVPCSSHPSSPHPVKIASTWHSPTLPVEPYTLDHRSQLAVRRFFDFKLTKFFLTAFEEVRKRGGQSNNENTETKWLNQIEIIKQKGGSFEIYWTESSFFSNRELERHQSILDQRWQRALAIDEFFQPSINVVDLGGCIVGVCNWFFSNSDWTSLQVAGLALFSARITLVTFRSCVKVCTRASFSKPEESSSLTRGPCFFYQRDIREIFSDSVWKEALHLILTEKMKNKCLGPQVGIPLSRATSSQEGENLARNVSPQVLGKLAQELFGNNYEVLEALHQLENDYLLNQDAIPEALEDDPVLSLYTCPISLSPVRYPVIDPTNRKNSLYEFDALMAWIKTKGTSPCTRESLNDQNIPPAVGELRTIERRLIEIQTQLKTYLGNSSHGSS